MKDLREISRLEDLAYEMRRKLLILCGSYEGAVHIGGDLSMTDLLIALYHHTMNVNPDNIAMSSRDRFILSKGHGAVGMYIAMALRGFFDYDEIVRTYGKLDSAYGMHPCKVNLPGVECSSGSLGHGLSIAVGMAISAKTKNEKQRVFCLLGDGETCEGSVWEAAMAGRSYELGNLIAIVDRNRQLMTSYSEEAVVLEPYVDKWRAFGWDVVEINGNDMAEIVETFDKLPCYSYDRPTAVIANTIKGKGVPFMERDIGWHAGKLSKEDMDLALEALAISYRREGSYRS